MKKYALLPIFIFSLLAGSLSGQIFSPTVQASAGASLSGPAGSDLLLEFTVGETVIQTLTSPVDNMTLAQGFHQRSVLIVDTEELDWDGFHVNLYPNPASMAITLEFDRPSAELLTAEIWNLLGQRLKFQPEMGKLSVETVDVSSLPSGHYFLRFFAKNRALEAIPFQIIK
ncbi:MAG: T9SS type A sorting domain-containing protein [Saprospiraceae bacterium]